MASRQERTRSDADAFGRVLSPLLTPAYRLAFGLALDQAAAEAAVIKAAEKAYRARGQLRPGSSLWRWFASIVRREVRPVELPVNATLPLTAHEPELRRLRRLTAEDRAVLLMHYYVDLSMDELASAERLSKVEVRARLALARERVRPLLTEPDAVGQLDDGSLAHRLRSLIGGLGDPSSDFQVRVEEALAGGFKPGSYQRPLLAIVAAIALLALIPLAPTGLRALHSLSLGLKPVAASQPKLATTPSESPRPSLSPVPTVIPSSAPEATAVPTGTPTPQASTPTPAPRTPTPAPPPGALVLSDAGMPPGEVGVGWPGASYSVSGGTGPYRWSVSPANPFGLSVNAGATTLSLGGTPSSAGSDTVTISVSDARGQSQSHSYGLSIAPPLSISGPSGGNGGRGEVGVPLQAVSFSAGGGLGGYSWAVSPGPPPGMSVQPNGASLAVLGAPSSPGDFAFTATVSDGAGVSQSASFSLHVVSHVVVTTGSLQAQVGVAYSQPIEAGGGAPPYTWAADQGNLAATGLSVSAGASAVVSGTPTQPGTFSFTVTVTDSYGVQSTRTLTISVS